MNCFYEKDVRRTAFITWAESKEKHGVWDPMPELTITSLYAAPESTPTHLPWETLCQSRLYPPVRDFGFGLCLSMCVSCSVANSFQDNTARLGKNSFIEKKIRPLCKNYILTFISLIFIKIRPVFFNRFPFSKNLWKVQFFNAVI